MGNNSKWKRKFPLLVRKSIAFPNTFWKHHNTLARLDVTDEKIAWSKKKMCGNIE